ncbi:MAG: hypothetical protein AAF518_17280 [Spirochaetota bacterium]
MRKQICIFNNCLVLCWLLLTCQTTGKNVQTSPSIKPVEKKKVFKYVTNKSGLVLWKDAKQRNRKILTLPYASQVEVLQDFGEEKNLLGTTGKWLQVRYKNKEGWAFGGFLVKHLLKTKKMHSLEKLEENTAKIQSLNSKRAYTIALNQYKAALRKLSISQPEGVFQLKQACNLADTVMLHFKPHI